MSKPTDPLNIREHKNDKQYMLMNYGKLSIITGPMWSGKTTELLRQFDRKEHAQLKCLLVKHGMDTRYDPGKGQVATHQSTYGTCTKGQAVVYNSMADLITGEGLLGPARWDTVFIDEIQFFPDKKLCLELLNAGINVVVAGLNGDYKQEMFADMDVLFAHAESIMMLTAVCGNCRSDDAPFSCKLQLGVGAGVLDVGGAEKYIPLCLKCMKELKK
jgi:thymidine kinase